SAPVGTNEDESPERKQVRRTRYVYTDEREVPQYAVTRIDYDDGTKSFFQNPLTADGRIAQRGKGAMFGVPLLLFELPRVVRAAQRGETIYLVEGEKSVLAVREYIKTRKRRPIVATTAPSGAGQQWKVGYTEALRGAKLVVIVADNDPSGFRHAAKVYDALAEASIRAKIVRSATEGEHDDVVDHLNEGHHLADLVPVGRDGLDALVGDDNGDDEDEPPPDKVPSSWNPLDLTDALAGNRRAEPSVLVRADGRALLYPGRTHVVYGEPESMKSWLCLVATAEQLAAGSAVLYVDFEDDEHETVDRLRCLGVRDTAIKEGFIYVRPDDPLPSKARKKWMATIATYAPSLVVLDGVTEGMALHGLEPLDNRDIAEWNRLPRALADAAVDLSTGYLGPAVVSIDHAAKDRENRSGPLGGVHKTAGISGAAYYLEASSPFGLGLEGVAKVRVVKDRPGRVREVAAGAKHNQAGSLTLSSDRDTRRIESTLDVSLTALDVDRGELTTHIPHDVLEAVSQVFEEAGEVGYSKKAVEARVTGKGASFRRPAIEKLIGDGYVAKHPTAKWHFVSVKPWKRGTDGAFTVPVEAARNDR
ncbi:MAG: AAA family ATPase, partial [Actinobacteria bacterium]|nr:AAA family ATPase [Actinomycetota bacterium]